MKRALLWAALCSVLCLVARVAGAAPIVEISSEDVQLALPPYVDVLEDPEGSLTIGDVLSERYAFQFAPASVNELFFGYTRSVYWMRFTVENLRDKDIQLVLEVLPPDVDYLDLYTVNPQTAQMREHHRFGSATPYGDRIYRVPAYLFDLGIESHGANTYYLRAESDKTVNLELSLNTLPAYVHTLALRLGWQGFLIGALLAAGILHLVLYALFSYRSFLWYGLFLLSASGIQLAWHGFLLPFFPEHDQLLDRQVLLPIHLALVFSALFAQTLLKTRRRVLWQHRVLSVLAGCSLLCMPALWVLSPEISALGASLLALCSVVFIFAATLHANMEGLVVARHFLIARTLTTSVVLVSIFNVHGYLPQGSFTQWGIAGAVLLEALVMAGAMAKYRLEDLRESYVQSQQEVPRRQEHSLVNLSDICHELRTPISGVMGMADLLLNGNLTDQQRNQIRTIHRSGQALLDVTNKLSDLSSIEQGTLELNVAPFELTPLVESCVENCRGRAEFNNIELIYHIDSDAGSFVRGDQEKLQQTIINLLQFALRHVEQGEVVLSVQPAEAGKTAFHVRSGQNTLLDRTVAATDRQLGSSDHLNLTIAEQYIRLMGGDLAVQSYVDGGVSIRFVIGLDVHEHPAAAVQHDDAMLLQGRRMLIVDDNATCCSIIEQQATQWGMSVMSAHGGKEALAILRSRTTVDELFDIVLTDYDMPGMNGLELAAHIREDANINSERLLLIMLTGVSKGPGKITSDGAIIHRVLYKPLSGKSLKQALQVALSQHLQQLR